MLVETRDLLVTGPPRSGTLSIARALQAMGLDIGHETMGKDGCVSSLLGFPSKDAGREHLGTHLDGGLERFAFRHVARILREPLETIASLAYCQTPGLWRFVEEELGPVEPALRVAHLLGESQWIERAARTWLAWEQAISQTWGPFHRIGDGRFDRAEIRIGDLTGSLEKIAVWLDRDLPVGTFHEHRSQHPTLSWKELEAQTSPELCSTIRSWAMTGGYA